MNAPKRIAVYAGSFDPITFGHLDIATRGSKLFDQIIIAIGENPKKRYTLDLETHLVYLSLDLYLSLPPPAQGCASWARNPKGPQITPFCRQLGRHPTVLDATSAGFRQISARRSLGGSRPLNLNFFFPPFWSQKMPTSQIVGFF